ncbi:hypothetical protein Ct9H90mP29_08350 [bacterium]|nr:MAG: hypothetical protein Ct9H90mP29_08350 [bacterium]
MKALFQNKNWIQKSKSGRANERESYCPCSEKANEQHYEVPPSFFEEALGSNLKYSSAIGLVAKQPLINLKFLC